jgi:NAD(P)-dependent dehydrogenase (short-subunit alcohol dehydrogenase family)
MTTVVITGAAGNIGTKLRRHFESLGWTLRLLDAQAADPSIHAADLALWDESWARLFHEADAVIHLAADPSPRAGWDQITRLNIDLTFNVFEAAVRQRAGRLIFASSNWVVAGHRFEDSPLTPETPPYPVNPYGISKLIGERLGRSYSERWGISVVCFRIGYCQRGENRPGPHMGWGLWGQQMWLSDRDLCQGFEKAVTASPELRFAVLNLMSRNDGMRWDLEPTRAAIGYVPLDHATPHESSEERDRTEAAWHARGLIEATEEFVQERRW